MPALLDTRADGRPPLLAVLGAHCDDVEIGAGATLLALAAAHPGLRVVAAVLTSTPERADEARRALPAFLPGADVDLTVHDLPDGRLPAHWGQVKDVVHDVAARAPDADLVLAPVRHDAHQDHRLVARIVPTAFRRAPVLGYEILKWDGDLGRPSVYVPAANELAERKWALLHEHFPSQRHRDWFTRDALLGLMRVRGVECHQRYAEAFTTDKMTMHATEGRPR